MPTMKFKIILTNLAYAKHSNLNCIVYKVPNVKHTRETKRKQNGWCFNFSQESKIFLLRSNFSQFKSCNLKPTIQKYKKILNMHCSDQVFKPRQAQARIKIILILTHNSFANIKTKFKMQVHYLKRKGEAQHDKVQ